MVGIPLRGLVMGKARRRRVDIPWRMLRSPRTLRSFKLHEDSADQLKEAGLATNARWANLPCSRDDIFIRSGWDDERYNFLSSTRGIGLSAAVSRNGSWLLLSFKAGLDFNVPPSSTAQGVVDFYVQGSTHVIAHRILVHRGRHIRKGSFVVINGTNVALGEAKRFLT